VGGVVLLTLLRAAVAGWRLGAAVVLKVRHVVRPSNDDDRRSDDEQVVRQPPQIAAVRQHLDSNNQAKLRSS
jgi:hypothetical protein